MPSFTSGWEAPGRPWSCRFAESAPSRQHCPVRVRTSMDHECTFSRTVLRLMCFLTLAVSYSQSAPVPSLSPSLVQQLGGALPESVEAMPSAEEQREEVHLLREERAVRTSGKWTNATIPFSFDTDSLSLVQRNRIIKAMKIWQKKTCIRFMERTDEDYYVKIYRDDAACYSEVGMKRYRVFKDVGQPMQLSQTSCLSSRDRGKIVHELGHVIGLHHEHQRPDRDEHVEILWGNLIQSDEIRDQYEIVESSSNLGTPYDLHSIMHYGPTDNSRNGLPTLTVLNPRFQGTIRNRTRPSSTDYRQVNLFYSCPEIDRNMENEDRRPNFLPTSANDLRSGDRLSLSPEIPDSNTTWWLNCTDGCKLSDAAGKKFKSNDVSECSELIYELHKVAGDMSSMYIKVGDTVEMRHRSMGDVDMVSCTFPDGHCAYRPQCIDHSSGVILCPSNELNFVIGAVGKVEGDQLMHKDRLIFNIPTLESGRSWMECDDVSLKCSNVNCIANTFMAEGLDKVVCKEPFTFLVTKL